ncbi:MAG: (E)-4-hydroxy-3-methylbut-2-enyl-diphosphate synthase, partial [Gemmatimonadetes bacterium]|nr:(E)-4-hydroxy-3-methylbut-2-enyl-diphosphate synthase [Gemmatimonadota bacterium]
MKRRETRTARIGGVLVGGGNPIVIQSMTVSDTNDIAASVAEVIALANAGAQIVRLTVPSVKAAESCREIHRRVREAGVDVPLVADIHYTPNAAMLAADIMEKVRVNPGNYFDRPGRGRSRDDSDFATGAARVREQFGPLVEKLKANGAALRVGVNHGSLSGRMTAEYGDTPNGMVQSAIEYLEVCERLGFHDVVVSLKASIPAVTVAANRLFAEEVDKRGWKTPLHVGVTEAGMGEEGRIRSAAGIGTLLSEGIGDTIRVSLTENPVHEIPAAREILKIAAGVIESRAGAGRSPVVPERAVTPVTIGGVTVGPGEPFA